MQLTEARTKELMASKQADDAAAVINALNLEINLLKRKLKMYESEKANETIAQGLQNQQDDINEEADREFDDMVNHPLDVSVLPGVGGDLNKATLFDKWKMNEFLFSPDTPAASQYHDKEAVDMLVRATHAEYSGVNRQTKSRIAKAKRNKAASELSLDTSRVSTASAFGLGANAYEALSGNFDLLDIPLTKDPNYDSLSPMTKNATKTDYKDYQFFLNNSSTQMWGGKSSFDRNNRARMNLWATSIENPDKHLNNTRPSSKSIRLTAIKRDVSSQPKSDSTHTPSKKTLASIGATTIKKMVV